jgi:fatty acid amide hydrolase
MITEQSLTDKSASELAALIAEGEITATEVVAAHIERIEAINQQINAVVVKRYEAALAEAEAADAARQRGEALGPLHGVPITVKECLDLAGLPTTFGLGSRVRHCAAEDDPYVARLRQAGAIVLGKTNVPQLLVYYESRNPLYGRTCNPWNQERSSGGSSGGEAAIIAAGGSPLGIGNDIGGSLRVPAHFCGISSLKPTTPRILDFTRMAESPRYGPVVTAAGPMARDLRDLALALRLMNEVPNPLLDTPQPLGEMAEVDVGRLRVAYYTDDGTFTPSPAIKRAVREAAEILRAAGAQVTEWTPPDAHVAMDLYYRLLTSDSGQLLRGLLGREKAEPQIAAILFLTKQPRWRLRILEQTALLAGQRSLAKNLRSFGYPADKHFPQIEAEITAYRRRFAEELDHAEGGPFDLILCPPCPLPAYTHGASQQLGVAGGYAILYNLLRYPAGVVPVTRVRPHEEIGRIASLDVVERTAREVERGSAGLPVGVQLVARPWQEHVALAAMQTIQAAARARDEYPRLSIDHLF